MKSIYPITVVADRYNGAYSGTRFLAFNLFPSELPDAIGSNDMDEEEFWGGEEHTKFNIGKGESVQEAYNDLLNQY